MTNKSDPDTSHSALQMDLVHRPDVPFISEPCDIENARNHLHFYYVVTGLYAIDRPHLAESGHLNAKLQRGRY